MLKQIAEKQPVLPTKGTRREIVVNMHGVDVKVSVSDARQELDIRLGALIKNATVGTNGGLSMLPWEKAVVNPRGEPVKFSAATLKPFVLARHTCLKVIGDAMLINIQDIVDMITRKLTTYLGQDPTFVLELAMASAIAEHLGTSMVQHQIQEALPSQDKETSFAEVQRKLQTLRVSDLANMLPPSKKSDIELAIDVVKQLERGICPSSVRTATGFLKQMFDRCLRIT